MDDINIYDNRLAIIRTKEEKIYVKFIIFFIIFSLLLIICLFIKYPKIYYFEGIANDNDIVLLLSKDELKYLKGNTITIDNEEYKYYVRSILELDNEIDYIKYYSVRIYTNDDYIDNDVIDFTINDGKTNIFNSIVKKIWKGFNNG